MIFTQDEEDMTCVIRKLKKELRPREWILRHSTLLNTLERPLHQTKPVKEIYERK